MVSLLFPFGTRTDGRRFKDTQVVPDFSDFTGRGYDFTLLTYKDYVKISIKKGWVYKLHQRKPVFPEKTVFLSIYKTTFILKPDSLLRVASLSQKQATKGVRMKHFSLINK